MVRDDPPVDVDRQFLHIGYTRTIPARDWSIASVARSVCPTPYVTTIGSMDSAESDGRTTLATHVNRRLCAIRPVRFQALANPAWRYIEESGGRIDARLDGRVRDLTPAK